MVNQELVLPTVVTTVDPEMTDDEMKKKRALAQKEEKNGIFEHAGPKPWSREAVKPWSREDTENS